MSSVRRLALVLFLLPAALYVAAASAAIPKQTYDALQWRNIGPFLGGRSIAVAGNAATPDTFYFGATGGGIWKTTDGGKTWQLVSGDQLNAGVIGALAVAPSDPNVVYAGTGESDIRGDMATGDGIYKSTDGGHTWAHIGLAHTHVISRIAVDPHDPDTVYVAALGHVFGPNDARGVYKSTDGGKTWHKVLYVNDKTGAIDIEIDPHNSRVLYAAMWQAYRRPWMLSSGGPGSGLYKSTDGGAHWTNISRHPGLPKGVLGKIGVSVSGADSSRVYALVEAKNGGVFRSDNAGKTWQRVNHDSKLTQRAWYFTRIYADPQNKNIVYAPQVAGVFKSTDGGNSFSALNLPHGDVHAMWINPKQPDIMIAGNDGGAAVSEDGGQSWSSERNQPTGQFYHVALDKQFPFHVYGAQQDRGSVEVASASSSYGISADDIWNVAGGESGFVVPVPGKPWITYGGGYSGYLIRYNRRTDQRRLVNVWPENPMGHPANDLKERFHWTFPIMISQHAPHALYVASQYIFRSTNGGMSWTRISPDLTRNLKDKQKSSGGPITQDNTSVEYYDTVFALAGSPVKQGVLWSGSNDGLVYVSKDDGKHWRNVTPDGLPKLTTISIIEPSHFDAGTAYLAARRYEQDDFKPYIYKTTDYGAHWTRITDGLPDDQSSFVVRQDTQDKNLLFAGTLEGVYVSFNDGDRWQPLQLNLPPVPVRDIAIQPRASAVVLATHGRGFWVLDDIQPLREMSGEVANADHHLFQPEPAYLTRGFHFDKALAYGIGENPDSGVVVYFDLKKAAAKDEKVSLTFMTSAGDKIASFSNQTDAHGKPLKKNNDFYPPKEPQQPGVVPAHAGMNRFVWDMRYPDATKVPGAVIWFGSMRGPKIVPGTYKVKLTIGKDSVTRSFEVREDPRSQATQADLEAQLALLKKVHAKLDETDKAILRLRKARDAINDYLGRLKDNPHAAEIKKTAKPMVAKLTDIENALIQTKSHSGEDPLNYPIRLNNKLAALAAEIGSGYGRPTRQDYQVFGELSTRVDKQLQALRDVLQQQLPKLNRMIDNSGIEPIAVQDET
ncbi:MAG TPA: glycosyl hydrolase [Gammaproteobacteria bacterium]|nr:glycosyl hydrolase [Gammaproteobacteria bacterium]